MPQPNRAYQLFWFTAGSTIATVLLSSFIIACLNGRIALFGVALVIGGAVALVTFPWAWLVVFLNYKVYCKVWFDPFKSRTRTCLFGALSGFVALVGPAASLGRNEGVFGLVLSLIMVGSGVLVGALLAPIVLGGIHAKQRGSHAGF